MSMSSPTSTSSTPRHELVKDIREDARLFIKLDLAYLAAGGAIVTALKISRYELIEFIAALQAVGIAYVALLVLDVLANSLIYREWVAARLDHAEQMSVAVIAGVIHVEMFFHLLFVAGVVVAVIAYSGGYSEANDEIRARVHVQDEFDAFVSSAGRLPTSLDEVRKLRPSIGQWLDRLGDEPIAFEKSGTKGYRLTFAGRDKVLGTVDDFVGTPELPLRRTWEAMQQERQRQKPDHK